MNQPDPERIALVIAAHPDDGDFGCAGYVARLARDGWATTFLVCTNGAKGTEDRDMPRERLISLRRDEQREACRRMGAGEVLFLDNEDGELAYDRSFLESIVRVIRTVRPHTVFTHDPTDIIIRDSFINHPDHRATGTAALDAVYPTARDHLNFPEHLDEGLEPHKVRRLLLWGSNHPNFDVDITDDVDIKIDALTAHVTQFGNREDFVTFSRERWKDENGRYIEQFRKIDLQF
ncbi:MAG: PIG-L family deacetylase [Dehalococcoidia bacterium]|nr:PIG-L family deacetylase [Dehalococcoidia bacterium]MCA9845470.1 PIG-L family deacetylase [Dehalococcoidia bacterium]MCA9852823.1 PIG-L family deacetylase [Dehalococcoidia bacterium]